MRLLRKALFALAAALAVGVLPSAHAAPRAIIGTDIETLARVLALDNGPRPRFSTSTIDGFINEAGEVYSLEVKKQLKTTSFQLALNTTFYAMPNDYVQVWSVSLDDYYLQEGTPESLAARGQKWRLATGRPTHFFVDFSTRSAVGFYPYPADSSSTGTVKVYYWGQDSVFLATATVGGTFGPEFRPYNDAYAYYAAYRMTVIDGRLDLAAIYKQEWLEYIARAVRELNQRPNYRPGATGRE